MQKVVMMSYNYMCEREDSYHERRSVCCGVGVHPLSLSPLVLLRLGAMGEAKPFPT